MTNRNRYLISCALALALAAAVGAGATSVFLSKTAPLPMVLPEPKPKPFTFLESPIQMRQDFCLRSKAYREVSFSDVPLDRFRFDPSQVYTTVIADRGFLCIVIGRLTRYHRPGVISNEQKSWTFLLDMSGASEVISPDFANQLKSSPVIRALGSNPVN